MATASLYTTLWLITNAYAAPLGYYGSAQSCQEVADTMTFQPPAQVRCVPSETAVPLAFNYSGQMPGMKTPTAAAPQASIADISKVNMEGEPFIGSPAAPVVMAYWFDYQCPFCRQEEETAFPRLIKEYVDTGKLRIVFKDLQFLGPDSQAAGLASRAVWETAPESFGAWHKAMFDKQDDENAGWGSIEDILALTRTIPGIDAAKVESLIASRAGEYQQAMDADAAEGNEQGVGGTPTLLIGKQIMVGVQTYERLKAAIDSELAAAK